MTTSEKAQVGELFKTATAFRTDKAASEIPQ